MASAAKSIPASRDAAAAACDVMAEVVVVVAAGDPDTPGAPGFNRLDSFLRLRRPAPPPEGEGGTKDGGSASGGSGQTGEQNSAAGGTSEVESDVSWDGSLDMDVDKEGEARSQGSRENMSEGGSEEDEKVGSDGSNGSGNNLEEAGEVGIGGSKG